MKDDYCKCDEFQKKFFKSTEHNSPFFEDRIFVMKKFRWHERPLAFYFLIHLFLFLYNRFCRYFFAAWKIFLVWHLLYTILKSWNRRKAFKPWTFCSKSIIRYCSWVLRVLIRSCLDFSLLFGQWLRSWTSICFTSCLTVLRHEQSLQDVSFTWENCTERKRNISPFLVLWCHSWPS